LSQNRSGKDDFKFFFGSKFFRQGFPKTSVTDLLLSCSASATMMPSGPRR
jgi:hypothetical protein